MSGFSDMICKAFVCLPISVEENICEKKKKKKYSKFHGFLFD
jgi:hypothetical protein